MAPPCNLTRDRLRLAGVGWKWAEMRSNQWRGTLGLCARDTRSPALGGMEGMSSGRRKDPAREGAIDHWKSAPCSRSSRPRRPDRERALVQSVRTLSALLRWPKPISHACENWPGGRPTSSRTCRARRPRPATMRSIPNASQIPPLTLSSLIFTEADLRLSHIVRFSRPRGNRQRRHLLPPSLQDARIPPLAVRATPLRRPRSHDVSTSAAIPLVPVALSPRAPCPAQPVARAHRPSLFPTSVLNQRLLLLPLQLRPPDL